MIMQRIRQYIMVTVTVTVTVTVMVVVVVTVMDTLFMSDVLRSAYYVLRTACYEFSATCYLQCTTTVLPLPLLILLLLLPTGTASPPVLSWWPPLRWGADVSQPIPHHVALIPPAVTPVQTPLKPLYPCYTPPQQ